MWHISAVSPSCVSAWTRPQLDVMPQDISLGVPLFFFSTAPMSHPSEWASAF